MAGKAPIRKLLNWIATTRVLADGGKDDYAETWVLLFDAGGDARANGVPFDEGRTQPWKEGWIAADINVGLAGFED